MAKIKREGKEIEVGDGKRIIDACRELGVPFSCENGTCGVCLIQIKSGKENLSPLTQAETDMGLDSETRLACQCKIKSGEVEIE